MSASVLQDFLDNSFIKIVDEESIAKLEKASLEIQKALRKKEAKTVNYTLVALDPVISDDDPVICEAELIITKHWKTFKNSVASTQDKPITYIQAVILDALQSLSKDIKFAGIIWYTSNNIIKHYKLAGKEEVLKNFLLPIAKKVEEHARGTWAAVDILKIDPIKPIESSLSKTNQVTFSEDKLKEHLLSAAVHSAHKANADGFGENPHQILQNHWSWNKFFAERASKGIAQEINSMLELQAIESDKLNSNIEKALNTTFAEIQPYFESVSLSVLQITESQKKRSDLMWWKQSLYSHSLDKSYRQLQSLAAVLAMSVDLNNSLVDISPKSVDYFLEETLRDVLGEEVSNPIEFSELIKQLIQLNTDEKELLQSLTVEYQGRKLLGSYLVDIINSSMNEDEFFQCSPIKVDTKITLSELTVWLLHDLKVQSLANSK